MTSLVAPFFAVNSGGCESEFSPHVSEKRFHKIKLELCTYVCILIRMIGLLNNLSLSLSRCLSNDELFALVAFKFTRWSQKSLPVLTRGICVHSLYFFSILHPKKGGFSRASSRSVQKTQQGSRFSHLSRTPNAATVLWHAHQPSRQMICPPSPSRLHRHLDFQPSDQAPFSFLPRWRLFVRKR